MPLCKHVAEWKQERGGRLAYRPLQKGFLAQEGNTVQLGSSCVCLHCAAAQNSFTKLREYHVDAGQHGHVAACDTRRRELFCSVCSDYVYDADFDTAMLGVSAVKLNVPGLKETEVAAMTEPAETKADSVLAGGAASAAAEAKARAISKAHSRPYGLRGLSNLGNTCFMNSVLQAMVHAPLLRNFYLSGGHTRSQCQHSLAKPCLSCELDGIFSASYSGATQPFSPAAFLHAWWRHADHHLASYQQQDAHEFYLYALAGLGQSRLLPDEAAAPAAAPAPLQGTVQRLQLPQMEQEPDMGSQAAGLLLQQPQPPKPEPAECLLMPSPHALHVCFAEPLQLGLVTSGLHGSGVQGNHMHSSAPLPPRQTNGHTATPAHPHLAPLNHSMPVPNPSLNNSNHVQHNSSVPHQRPVPQHGPGHPSYNCHTHRQDGRSGTLGGTSLLSVGQGQDAVHTHPRSGQPGPEQPSRQQQSLSSGHQAPSHDRQHSVALPYANGYPQSRGHDMQQAGSWQQQQTRALLGQHPKYPGQLVHSGGLQQSAPAPANASAPSQRHCQQPSMLGGQKVPQVKQETPSDQQSNQALSRFDTWRAGEPGRAGQQVQVPHQHAQSTGGILHSQPQRQHNSHTPSIVQTPQDAYHQQHNSYATHSRPLTHEGSQPPPLTIQQQFQALQQDIQPMIDAQEPLLDGSVQQQAKPEPPSQQGLMESESIVQRIFGGVLQSEVICSACCHISTAHDPFLDISLDIGAPPLPPPPLLKPPSHAQHRHPGGPKRLTGAAAMAVAAAQKRAAVSAPAEVSASGTPEPHGLAVSAPLQQTPQGSRLGADAADALDSRTRSDAERISPDIDVVSIAGDVLSQRALSDNNGSMDKSGSQNAEEAARSWQGTPALEEPLTRRGSTEADVPAYRASPTQASERDFASTTRDPMCSEGASSGIVGNSQDIDEAMSTPSARMKQRPSSGAGRGVPSSLGTKRPSRCMQCATCLKPQLKKACLRNKALRSMGSLDTLPSLDALSVEAAPPEPFSRPSPSPDAASTPSKASAHRIRSEEAGLEPSSRSPSLTFPTRACLPHPETPHGIPVTSLTANGSAPEQPRSASGRPPRLPGAVSLLGCLQRFVRPERLGAAEHWVCSGCARPQHAVKQMSVHRLPPVLCLHVKRFEHTGIGKKLYTPLDFAAYLDMRPYLSSSVMHARLASQGLQGRQQGRGALPAVPPQRAQRDADTCMYELYTVVCHRGNLQGGHYVSYVKCKDAWYLADDNAVFQVDERTACCPSAYMLFYRQLAIES